LKSGFSGSKLFSVTESMTTLGRHPIMKNVWIHNIFNGDDERGVFIEIVKEKLAVLVRELKISQTP